MNKKWMTILLVCFVVCGTQAQKANFRAAEKFRKVADEVGSLQVSPHFLEDSDKFW